eukprot:g2822.t1
MGKGRARRVRYDDDNDDDDDDGDYHTSRHDGESGDPLRDTTSSSASSMHHELAREHGLTLVDFGRGIDRRLFAPGTRYTGDDHCSGFTCVEMLEGRSWTTHVDTYGLCASIHVLLFGKYMELVEDEDDDNNDDDDDNNDDEQEDKRKQYEDRNDKNKRGRFRPAATFRRYWQRDDWVALFDAYLNTGRQGGDLSEPPPLVSFRRAFETRLYSNKAVTAELLNALGKYCV